MSTYLEMHLYVICVQVVDIIMKLPDTSAAF